MRLVSILPIVSQYADVETASLDLFNLFKHWLGGSALEFKRRAKTGEFRNGPSCSHSVTSVSASRLA